MKETVEQIIAILRQPLSDDERQAGWQQSLKDGYVAAFTKLLTQIERGEDIPYFGIVRSLDAWGIGGGHLWDMMIRVANEVNDQLR